MKHILVISHVDPFVDNGGQNKRVLNTIKALNKNFTVDLLLLSNKNSRSYDRHLENVRNLIVIPYLERKFNFLNYLYKLIAAFYILFVGGKTSNFSIGVINLRYSRLSKKVDFEDYDIILFEYWHGFKLSRKLKKKGLITIVDTHNILYETYKIYINKIKWIPLFVKNIYIRKYKNMEQKKAWLSFDYIIAINKSEKEIILRETQNKLPVLFAPMGIEIDKFTYSWQRTNLNNHVIVYYGGLASEHNSKAAIYLINEILPKIQKRIPETELRIVGSKPRKELEKAAKGKKVQITGYVENIEDVLKDASLALIPWSGTYGFRSRIIELMAIGLPIITTTDALYGMGFKDGENVVFVENSSKHWINSVFKLFADNDFAESLSVNAYNEICETYSFMATYEKLSIKLSTINVESTI